jgi:hypothetical protein
LTDIKTDNNRLTVTKEQLQQMAEYRLENRNTGAETSTSPVQGGRLGTESGTHRQPLQSKSVEDGRAEEASPDLVIFLR